ncbi:hypothetical protein DPMN_168850 [Dreissena polymorpha]|uniref:Uncharacterized protein n=1 Tax=Dreissena polymorpha TaxID=45954 RepID=A0A9D4F1G7_DREPO|nr:hypothetical protein DPMN_168850 [Dreissena polymorpha]
MKKEEDSYNNMLKSAEVLLKEATTKIGIALKEKYVVDIQAAKGVLESANSRMEKGRNRLQYCEQIRISLGKKKEYSCFYY